MRFDTTDQATQPSRLLQLPRKIQDLIYEHSIVRNTTPIDCAVIEGPGYRKHTGFRCPFSPQLHEDYPLNRDVVHRSVWSLSMLNCCRSTGWCTLKQDLYSTVRSLQLHRQICHSDRPCIRPRSPCDSTPALINRAGPHRRQQH